MLSPLNDISTAILKHQKMLFMFPDRCAIYTIRKLEGTVFNSIPLQQLRSLKIAFDGSQVFAKNSVKCLP